MSNIGSYLCLLEEKEDRLVEIGLNRILEMVDQEWAVISDSLEEMERISEDKKNRHNQLCSFILSKVYYHLEEYDESLKYSLEAGSYFDIHKQDKFTETLLNNCIAKFITHMRDLYYQQAQNQLDQRIISLVENILQQSIIEKHYKIVVGIALESMRIDILQNIIHHAKSSNSHKIYSDLLDYTLKISNKFVNYQKFRVQCLELLQNAYKSKVKQNAEYCNLSQCYFQLNNYKDLAQLLVDLIDGNLQQSTIQENQDTIIILNEENNQNIQQQELILLAFQIAQDLSENECQLFTQNLIQCLDEERMKYDENIIKLVRILDGTFGEDLKITFIKEMNKSDKQIIIELKKTVDNKNSVAHNAVVVGNSIMQTGTQSDWFMREYFDWCSKATHWSKFQLVSTLGSIHKGNHLNSMVLLKPYFNANPLNPYAYGGALYGLGLIHSNTKDQNIINFIINCIDDHSTNDQILHGGSLALGLVSIGSSDQVVYQKLKAILDQNNAITAEAAGLAIGLLMAGTHNKIIVQELLSLSRETEHEKIIRSLVIAIAMIMFKSEENSEELIEDMSQDKDPIIRYGAMQVIGMAYIGTSNQKSIRKLLQVASSDHMDDVKRSAALNLGFVMVNNLEKLVKIITLLVTSYNAHVRYGAAMALGIASHGKYNQSAVSILEGMLKDNTDIVRQAAYVSLGMILQHMSVSDSKREVLDKAIAELLKKTNVDNITRTGVITAQSILEAGGRNQTIQLLSRNNGEVKMRANLGMLVFLQSWYWFPFNLFFSLTLSPSAFLGVTLPFHVPKFSILSNSKPNLFDYNPPRQTVKTHDNSLTHLKLSMADKAKARKDNKDNKDNKDIELQQQADNQMQVESSQLAQDNEKQNKQQQILTNPCRVLPLQESAIQVQSNRYIPIIKNRKKGVVFMLDKNINQNDELFCTVKFKQPEKKNNNEEIIEEKIDYFNSPPQPFIYDEQKQEEYRKTLNSKP